MPGETAVWAQDGGTPTTALGALIVIAIMLAGGLGWLLRHLFGTALPAEKTAAREERETYKAESQAMRELYKAESQATRELYKAEGQAIRDLFDKRQDKLLEHCEAEADKERQASDQRYVQTERRFGTVMEVLKEIQQSNLNQNATMGQLLSLTRQRTYLSDVVQSAEEAIWSKTLDGIVTSWNRAAERLLGWSSNETIGRSVYALIPSDLHEQERNTLARLTKGEQPPPYESARLTNDGRRVALYVTISPIKDPTGRVVGASSIARKM